MNNAKKTPLYDAHIAHAGKIVEFGGWLLPVQYAGIIEEHQAVRKRAGLFDVSHMGEVEVKGPQALAYLQKLVTNDVARLADGQVQYTPMCYPDGGTVDDLLIYRYGKDEYLLVINAANIEKDWAWMQQQSSGFDVNLKNLSDQLAELALQGPAAEAILSRLTDAPLDRLSYYWFYPQIQVAGKSVLVSRTGYTGEDGFEIYCRPEDALALWNALLETGRADGLQPTGLGCRDTLRFEAALPLYGHELSASITPLEAGLPRFVNLEKGDFNGKNVLAEQKASGVKRKIIGFELTERGVARAEYPVLKDGQRIGVVTTGSYAPTLEKNIGLALVDAQFAKIGETCSIEIRGKAVAATIIGKPFYKREGK